MFPALTSLKSSSGSALQVCHDFMLRNACVTCRTQCHRHPLSVVLTPSVWPNGIHAAGRSHFKSHFCLSRYELAFSVSLGSNLNTRLWSKLWEGVMGHKAWDFHHSVEALPISMKWLNFHWIEEREREKERWMNELYLRVEGKVPNSLRYLKNLNLEIQIPSESSKYIADDLKSILLAKNG